VPLTRYAHPKSPIGSKQIKHTADFGGLTTHITAL
jgi:hypothetical protein